MIKFIHTADAHYGVENYGRINQSVGIHSRLLDYDKAFNFCIDRAIQEEVDFFLFAGDAYKNTTPTPTQQKLFVRSLLRLHSANIPVIIIVGNHDNPLSFGKANTVDIFGDLPLNNFYLISKPTSFTLTTKNGPVQIVGIPWPTKHNISISEEYFHRSTSDLSMHISTTVGQIIQSFARRLDPDIPSILTSHLTVSSGLFSGSEKRSIHGNDPFFLPSQLAIPPFDYVALGHLHKFQNLNPNGYPAIIYSGAVDRIDFGEILDDKGFCLVKLEKNNTTFDFIRLPIKKFIEINVFLNTDEDFTQQILKKIDPAIIKDSILKIIYHVPPYKKDNVSLKIIERACAEASFLKGIIPVRKPPKREFRAALKIDMDMGTLLNKYFENKPEFLQKKDLLISKILELQEEIVKIEEETI